MAWRAQGTFKNLKVCTAVVAQGTLALTFVSKRVLLSAILLREPSKACTTDTCVFFTPSNLNFALCVCAMFVKFALVNLVQLHEQRAFEPSGLREMSALVNFKL